jgi:hypothetical protein
LSLFTKNEKKSVFDDSASQQIPFLTNFYVVLNKFTAMQRRAVR